MESRAESATNIRTISVEREGLNSGSHRESSDCGADPPPSDGVPGTQRGGRRLGPDVGSDGFRDRPGTGMARGILVFGLPHPRDHPAGDPGDRSTRRDRRNPVALSVAWFASLLVGVALVVWIVVQVLCRRKTIHWAAPRIGPAATPSITARPNCATRPGSAGIAAGSRSPVSAMTVLGTMPSIQARPAPAAVARVQSQGRRSRSRVRSTRSCATPTRTPSSTVPRTTASSAPARTAAPPTCRSKYGATPTPTTNVVPRPADSAQPFAAIHRR
jgi:hypothetical protein